jgi:hypothetical protein
MPHETVRRNGMPRDHAATQQDSPAEDFQRAVAAAATDLEAVIPGRRLTAGSGGFRMFDGVIHGMF